MNDTKRLVLSMLPKWIDVAIRTVAKYRDMLNIPSSSQRRKQARLMKFASN